MSAAFILESAGETAGIVVIEHNAVRFHSAQQQFKTLNGKTFKSLRATERAVEALRQRRSPSA